MNEVLPQRRTGVTSVASPMRSGNGAPAAMPAAISTAAQAQRDRQAEQARQRAPERRADRERAERAERVQRRARERTQGGALVCVAVLKVDITAIHAAPPITSAT